MSWQIGLVCNAIIAMAYLLIVLAILVPLTRRHQLRSNPLGVATAAIFFTSAVHHGALSTHLLLPTLGFDEPKGLAMRQAWAWPLAVWGLVGAGVGVIVIYYVTLHRNHTSLLRGAQLFQDLRQREQHALELNNRVMQGLVVAKMALDLGQPSKAQEALTTTIESASRIITDLLCSEHLSHEVLRTEPARVTTGPRSIVAPALQHGRPAS